jgi:hypothetical protein
MHHHSSSSLNQGFEDKTGAIIIFLFALVMHHNFLALSFTGWNTNDINKHSSKAWYKEIPLAAMQNVSP